LLLLEGAELAQIYDPWNSRVTIASRRYGHCIRRFRDAASHSYEVFQLLFEDLGRGAYRTPAVHTSKSTSADAGPTVLSETTERCTVLKPDSLYFARRMIWDLSSSGGAMLVPVYTRITFLVIVIESVMSVIGWIYYNSFVIR
jgi:hypothetical protein